MATTVSQQPRRNRQFWISHIQSWQRSGLSKAAYCEEHDIKPGSFYNWSSKTNSESPTGLVTDLAQSGGAKPIQFHQVNLTPADADSRGIIYVERAATQVALPTDLTPELIHHWLNAIHQLHV